jgi:hypothetical protein
VGLLQDLLSGGRRRDDYQDFLNRYERGEPWDGISDREAVDRYREFANDMDDDEYMEAAQESFSRLTPEQRRQFARYIQSQGRQRDLGFTDRDFDERDDRYQDPRYLAQMTRQAQRRDPNMFEQMFGGSGQGSMLDNPIAWLTRG